MTILGCSKSNTTILFAFNTSRVVYSSSIKGVSVDTLTLRRWGVIFDQKGRDHLEDPS
jgi:hypothetical protein